MAIRSEHLTGFGTLVLAIAGIGVPVYVALLNQHDELIKHGARLDALEAVNTARGQAEDDFRREMRNKLDDIQKQVNQISIAVVNKQDRR